MRMRSKNTIQQIKVYPYPLGAGSARPSPRKGAPETEHPLFIGFTELGRGIETMVSDHGLGKGQTMGAGVDPSLLNYKARVTRGFGQSTLLIKGVNLGPLNSGVWVVRGMRILTHPENSRVNLSHQISNKNLRTKRWEGIRQRMRMALQMKLRKSRSRFGNSWRMDVCDKFR